MHQRMRQVAVALLSCITVATLVACSSSPKPQPTPTQSLSAETHKAVDTARLILDDIEEQIGKLALNVYGPTTDTGVSYSGVTAGSSPGTNFQLSVRHGTEVEQDWVTRFKSAKALTDVTLVTTFTANVSGHQGTGYLMELKKDYSNANILVHRQISGTIYVVEIGIGKWNDPPSPYNELQAIAIKRISEI